jgi:hypothetical protein
LPNIVYNPSKTGLRFHQSRKEVKCFKGPVGNGKSAACVNELLMMALQQAPNSDGVRKTRFVIVRNTHLELATTVLNTWKQWVPEEICSITMNPMIKGKMVQKVGDGTTVEMEVYFIPIACDDDIAKLKSLECTAVYINEAKYLPFSAVSAARERIGRYPGVTDGYQDNPDGKIVVDGKLVKGFYRAPRNQFGVIDPSTGDLKYEPCTRSCLIMDTNPPDTDHWWYYLAENGHLPNVDYPAQAIAETRRIFDFFDGPPALIRHADGSYIDNPNAENIGNLQGGYEYYRKQIAANSLDYINVNVLGMYGSVLSGKRVYPQFNRDLHVPKEHFAPIEGLPIGLGWDFGLTPTVTIGQMTDLGQVRVIAELCGEDIDVRSFARDIVKPYLQKHFRGYEIAFSWGDPTGNNRGEGEGRASIGILNDEYSDGSDLLDMGFRTEGASTNDPTKRVDAVVKALTRILSNGRMGMLVDSRCKMLIKGFEGGYCYQRLKVSGAEGLYRDKPDKGKYSHVHDSLQYLCLGFLGNIEESDEDDYTHNEYKGVSTLGY